MTKKQPKKWELLRDGQKWTQREEDLLRKLHPVTMVKNLYTRFDRTHRAIAGKARRLGLRKLPERPGPHLMPRPWSKKEIQTLCRLWRQGYGKSPIAEIIGRSVFGVKAQISKQVRKFRLRRRCEPGKPWSKKEIAYLVRNYQRKTARQIGEILGRAAKAIIGKAYKLGLTDEARPWTAKEIKMVEKYYKRKPTAKIAEELGRTVPAVRRIAAQVGLTKPETKWSDTEIRRLRRLWKQGYSKPQIVQILGKDINAVANQITKQAHFFRLQRRHKFVLWSKKEDDYLVRHYHEKTPKQIAEVLGRTRVAVTARAKLFHLTKPKIWKASELEFVKNHYSQWTARGIAQKLGKTTVAVQTRAYLMGLKKT